MVVLPTGPFSLRGWTVDVELQVEALAEHAAQALSATRMAVSLLVDETAQMRKVVLQNRMALTVSRQHREVRVPSCPQSAESTYPTPRSKCRVP